MDKYKKIKENSIISYWKYWIPGILLMGIIFYLSNLPEGQVPYIIKPIVKFINRAMGIMKLRLPFPVDWLKVGHTVGYILLGSAFYFTVKKLLKKRNTYFFALLFTFIYACTDEFHQIFIPGRSPEIKDILLDSTSAGAALVVIFLVNLFIQRRRTVSESQQKPEIEDKDQDFS
jgi:VanZ family protein